MKKFLSDNFRFLVMVPIAAAVISFQNCGGFSALSGSSIVSGNNSQSTQTATLNCPSGPNQGCTASNGSGNQVCAADGSGYGACVLSSCNPGYTLTNGACVANACTPGAIANCTVTNGSGSQVCNSYGTYGTCNVLSCNAGYSNVNNACVSLACSPNSTQLCNAGNGSGTETCASDGSGYGSCALSSCNPGYYLNNGSCLPNACTPGAVTNCTYGNGSGNATCNSTGSGYGTCQLTACNTGYNLQNGLCVQDVCTPGAAPITCTTLAGTSTQACNSTGSGYGACGGWNGATWTCHSGYTLASDGTCVAQTCSPNAVALCSSNNGTGVQVCNTSGTGYGACQLTACNAGYALSNGTCIVAACQTSQVTLRCMATLVCPDGSMPGGAFWENVAVNLSASGNVGTKVNLSTSNASLPANSSYSNLSISDGYVFTCGANSQWTGSGSLGCNVYMQAQDTQCER